MIYGGQEKLAVNSRQLVVCCSEVSQSPVRTVLFKVKEKYTAMSCIKTILYVKLDIFFGGWGGDSSR